jgi:hypothetical protein
MKCDDIETLVKLIYNESTITLEEGINSGWFHPPENLGDIAIIALLKIIQNKIKEIIFEESQENILQERSPVSGKTSISSLKAQMLLSLIKKTKFHEKMLKMLDDKSNTKKDVSILILSTISADNNFLQFLANKESIQKILTHIYKVTKNKYKCQKEHMLASLQLLRRIYVKNLSLRKAFLDMGGIQMLYEYLFCSDPIIVQEILYNIEDLIYVNLK